MTIKKVSYITLPKFPIPIPRKTTVKPGTEIVIWKSGGYDPDDWEMEIQVPERFTIVDEDTIEIQRVKPMDSERMDRKRVYTREEINDSGVGRGNIREYDAMLFPGRIYNFYWEPSLPPQSKK